MRVQLMLGRHKPPVAPTLTLFWAWLLTRQFMKGSGAVEKQHP